MRRIDARLKLTGPAPVAALFVFLAALAATLVFLRPAPSSWPILASLALWILFIAYWMNAALLLLFIPARGAAPPGGVRRGVR